MNERLPTMPMPSGGLSEHLAICASVGIGPISAMRLLEPGHYVLIKNLTSPEDDYRLANGGGLDDD